MRPIVVIVVISLALSGVAFAADLEIDSVPTGEKVYAGIKLLGTTPLALEDYRSGPLALRLPDGDIYEVEVPEGDGVVKVMLNCEAENKPSFFETGARWFIVGGVAAGIVALAILVLKPETSTQSQ